MTRVTDVELDAMVSAREASLATRGSIWDPANQERYCLPCVHGPCEKHGTAPRERNNPRPNEAVPNQFQTNSKEHPRPDEPWAPPSPINDALTPAGLKNLWDVAESGDLPQSVAYSVKLAVQELHTHRSRPETALPPEVCAVITAAERLAEEVWSDNRLDEELEELCRAVQEMRAVETGSTDR